jgi:hypothetical protein
METIKKIDDLDLILAVPYVLDKVDYFLKVLYSCQAVPKGAIRELNLQEILGR